MVNLNPITENFEETINGSNNSNTQDHQVVSQLPENKSGNDTPTIPVNNLTDKEITEAKKVRNELIAINVFAILGAIVSSIVFINQISSATNAKNIFGPDSFINIVGILLFLFMLKKSDMARKIIIIVEVATILLLLLLVSVMSMFSKFYTATLISLVPDVIPAILVICFLSSTRIKRHFA